MSHSTNNNVTGVNTCIICNLTFETRKQFIKHTLSDEHLKRARGVYDEEFFEVKDKDNTKGLRI